VGDDPLANAQQDLLARMDGIDRCQQFRADLLGSRLLRGCLGREDRQAQHADERNKNMQRSEQGHGHSSENVCCSGRGLSFVGSGNNLSWRRLPGSRTRPLVSSR
jgi:hypothetical protein